MTSFGIITIQFYKFMYGIVFYLPFIKLNLAIRPYSWDYPLDSPFAHTCCRCSSVTLFVRIPMSIRPLIHDPSTSIFAKSDYPSGSVRYVC